MYFLSLFYFKWLLFWRLPETEHSQRTKTSSYLKKLDMVRVAWMLAMLVMAAVGHLAFLIGGTLFMTFTSFMFLDESE